MKNVKKMMGRENAGAWNELVCGMSHQNENKQSNFFHCFLLHARFKCITMHRSEKKQTNVR